MATKDKKETIKNIEGGILNDTEQPKMPRAYRDSKTSNMLRDTQDTNSRKYETNILENRGNFRGIVLRKEERSSDDDGLLSGFLDFWGLGGDKKPNLAKATCRIPHVHGCCPVTFENPGREGQVINAFYHTFTSQSDLYTEENCPDAGEVVWCDYGDRENMSSPQLIKPVYESKYSPVFSDKKRSPRGSFGAGGAGKNNPALNATSCKPSKSSPPQHSIDIGSPIYGVDVSNYNYTVDGSGGLRPPHYKELSDAGIRFALIKISENDNSRVAGAKHHIDNFVKNGIPVGTYHFAHPHNDEDSDWEVEAENFVNTLRDLGFLDGTIPEHLKLLPFLDIEVLGIKQEGAYTIGGQDLIDWIEKFLGYVHKHAKVKPGVYVGPPLLNQGGIPCWKPKHNNLHWMAGPWGTGDSWYDIASKRWTPGRDHGNIVKNHPDCAPAQGAPVDNLEKGRKNPSYYNRTPLFPPKIWQFTNHGYLPGSHPPVGGPKVKAKCGVGLDVNVTDRKGLTAMRWRSSAPTPSSSPTSSNNLSEATEIIIIGDSNIGSFYESNMGLAKALKKWIKKINTNVTDEQFFIRGVQGSRIVQWRDLIIKSKEPSPLRIGKGGWGESKKKGNWRGRPSLQEISIGSLIAAKPKLVIFNLGSNDVPMGQPRHIAAHARHARELCKPLIENSIPVIWMTGSWSAWYGSYTSPKQGLKHGGEDLKKQWDDAFFKALGFDTTTSSGAISYAISPSAADSLNYWKAVDAQTANVNQGHHPPESDFYKWLTEWVANVEAGAKVFIEDALSKIGP